jgi:transcriptional regulator with XRE-family HTH domain
MVSGFTARECAIRAGMPEPSWSNWENDRSRRSNGSPSVPTPVTIKKLAAGLRMPVDEVMHAAFSEEREVPIFVEYRPTLVNDPDAQQPGDPVLDVVWDRLSPDQRTDELRRLARLAREPALPGVSGTLSQDDRDSGFEGLSEADECARLLAGMTAADRESALGYLRYLREKQGRG